MSCGESDDKVDTAVAEDSQSTIHLELQSPEATGIDFNNIIDDTGRINIFIWNFMYSGAGVAAGDINNDGLPDLYFAGNQVADRLYLNKGDFRFEDITERAGIADNLWSTGVTMADVNADGLLDIYVCKNSPTIRPDINRNKLFINAGGGRFQERAAEYGLADAGYSIQATFFDVDNDGDPDVYLVNQPVDQFAQYVNDPVAVRQYPYTDRLFLNEGGTFVDHTERMGLTNKRYGLAASLADFDLNGWTDIYISNDYHHGDQLLMNDNGMLSDEILSRAGHISFFSMGADIGDVNEDGHADCVVLDMAYEDHFRSKTNMESMDTERFWRLVADDQHFQYMHNTLQLNNGSGAFHEIAQLSGIAKTDWSWTPLFADLDLDARTDLLVTNGILRDMKNNDFREYVTRQYGGQVGPANYREVLARMPSNPVSNVLYQNKGDLIFEDITDISGFDGPGFSHGMAYADFDRDGMLDIAINNMNDTAAVYRNVSGGTGAGIILELTGPGTNRNGLGLTVIVSYGGRKQAGTMQTSRGYLSSSEPLLQFGLGDEQYIDSIEIFWNHREKTVLAGVEANQRINVDYHKAVKKPIQPLGAGSPGFRRNDRIPFVHTERIFNDFEDQVLLPYKLSQNGPFVARGDVDGDGLEDMYFGGAAGQPGVLFRQTVSGEFMRDPQAAFQSEKESEDGEAVFFDYDNDGDLDLYVVSGSNEFPEGDERLKDRLYRNDGSGEFVLSKDVLPAALGLNGQCVEAVDLNDDGFMDLFVGGRLVAGHYPMPASSKIMMNENGVLRDATGLIAPCLEDLGLVTDACVDDIDGDGDRDLVVVGEWMQPVVLLNDAGELTCHPIDVAGTGLWWTIEKGDFDNDGDRDFILGNLGWNNKFSGHKEARLEVFAGDFDNNGDHDIMLAKPTVPGSLPVRGRECMSGDLPFILEKYPSYSDFGKARVVNILNEEQRSEALYRKVSTFSSIYLQNTGDLTFSAHELPVTCQTGPVKAVLAADVDRDGHLDFIYAGNHFPTEVETARYDGLMHGVCLGDGTGNFTFHRSSYEELALREDVRDMTIVTLTDGSQLLVVTQNDGPVITFACAVGMQ